ncbi:MAG: sigma factor-like helix-turn-helix DNA-binding protein [Planctomycetota bacterium]
MSSRGRPSRRSLEARLKALAAELRRSRIKSRLSPRLPENESQLDRQAYELLAVYHDHQIPAAIELLFDIAAPLVAEIVVERLDRLVASLDPEEITARVFYEMSRPRGLPPAVSDHAFRKEVLRVTDEIISFALEEQRQRMATADPIGALLAAAGFKGPETTAPPFGLSRDEVKQIVARGFDALPELTQRCFYLHLVEGKSLADIAHELGLSLTAVSRRMDEARQRAFRAAAEHHWEDDGRGPVEPDDEIDEGEEFEQEGGEP